MTQTKRFPWRCAECRELEVHPCTIQNHPAKMKHDGRTYEVCIPEFSVAKCRACGALHFDLGADRQFRAALRARLRLLTPEQIREYRTRLGLTQQQIADALGIAPETVSRWESGVMIQSRANDRFMRLFFGMPDVREKLTNPEVVLADSPLVEGWQQHFEQRSEVDFSASFGLTKELLTQEGEQFFLEMMPQGVCPSGKVAA